MGSAEVTRRDPAYRLPRQAEHFVRLVDHILAVKDSPELRQTLVAALRLRRRALGVELDAAIAEDAMARLLPTAG